MTFTPVQQLQLLKSGRGGMARGLLIGLLALAIGLTIAGIITELPPYFMVASFLVLVALGSWSSVRPLEHAIQAIDHGHRVRCAASIHIDGWTDSDHYYAVVRVPRKNDWRFEFIPTGWRPQEGEIEVEAYFLYGIEWPVLLVGRDGILVPRETPRVDAPRKQ